MFRWEVQMKLFDASAGERLIIKADNIEEACASALKQAGDDWEVYSINKIWD